MSKPKISYILDNFAEFQSGCFEVRISRPFIELKDRGYDVDYKIMKSHPYTDLDERDIVMYSRYYGSDAFRSLWRHKSMGKKIVYDIDDDVWNIPKLNPAHATYKEKKKHIVGMCNEADVVTVSTERLKNMVLQKTEQENVKIVPNGIPLDKFIKRPNKKGLRIGWAGGSNHYEDLDIILDVIIELQEDYDFEFIIQGLTGAPWDADAYSTNMKLQRGDLSETELAFQTQKMEVYEKFRKIKNFRHVPFYPPEMFPSVIHGIDLDIGIIPIKGHVFDHSKSILKYLEYSAVGTAAIASKKHPYKDDVLYTVKNKYTDWKEGLIELIENEELRDNLAKQQYKQLFPKYSIKKTTDKLAKVYDELGTEN